MKSKVAGLVLLLAVIAAAGIYYLVRSNNQVIVLDGYLGGEKIGLYEDEEVAQIMADRFHIQFTYSRAGSLDMVTADQTGRDYLFPSSQTALEYYEDEHGRPLASEIVFNTPIVLYSHRLVSDALEAQGVVTEQDGVLYADMEKLTQMMLDGTSWADIGLPELYGSVSVDTTDPTKSNSGNMFAALLANVCNGGQTVTEDDADRILPMLEQIFDQLGYMETSSSDLFSQFLNMGVGAKPMIAGYESQLIEFAVQNPEAYEELKDDLVMIYPTPTVWSTHVYIALTEEGRLGAQALLDEDVQRLAWEKHGFRTSGYGIIEGSLPGGVTGVAQEVTQVIPVPGYDAMKKIIDGL